MEFTLEIERHDESESPREDYNLGTMVCSHRNYNLGDEQVERWEYWLVEMLVSLGLERETEQWDDFMYDLENGDVDAMQKAYNMISEKAIILPLFLYDHSGISMNTSGFNSLFDSGKVGYVYVTLDKIREEYGWKRVTKQRRELIQNYLKEEVKTYDQYLLGDVWGYILKQGDEVLDSCWGFYGYETAEAEGESTRQWHIKNNWHQLQLPLEIA